VFSALVDFQVFEGRACVGRISGRNIKVNVSFVLSIAGGADVLVLVECKNYKSKVPVDDVEEFHSKLDDIDAQKGILITTIGFQSGAVKAAKCSRIALALLSKEPQPGEIRYVMAKAGERELPPRRENRKFLQGNIKGVLGVNSGGIRFEHGGRLIGMLLAEAIASNPTES
jgi:predicted helicase